MAFDQAWDYKSAPFNGPFDMVARLIDAAVAADLPVEGVWTFAGWAKSQSLEISGSMSTLNLDLYGSNAIVRPLNTYSVAIGGSATEGDVLTLTFSGGAFTSGGQYALSYTVPAGPPTLDAIAASIAAAISADTTLVPLGFLADADSGVVTITFPSVAPGYSESSPTQPPPSNATSLVASANGGASETLTVAAGANGSKLMSVTELGFIALPVLPRWITGRLTTLTGTDASITADWHGAA